MKKLLAILLAASMTVGLCVSAAAADTELPITEGSSGVKTTGAVGLIAWQYLVFRNVDFTNVKSVKITGSPNWTSSWNGDIFALRIDSEYGELIGYVDFDKEGEHTFGCNVNITGTHDLYVVSTYGVAGSSTIKKVEISDTAVPEAEKYVPVDDSLIVDNYSDTWQGVSGLGRNVADYEEVGDVKEGKEVGLFYWIWNCSKETVKNVINNTTFQVEHPEAYKEDAFLSSVWPSGETKYFWGEPIYGYYSGDDYWVYRKDAELLADAGIDFVYFDDTNGRGIFRRNMEVFLKAFSDAKKAGVNVPKFAIASNMTAMVENTRYMLEYLYLTFYSKGLYSDLWYYVDGKPLIMAHPESLDKFVNKNDQVEMDLVDDIKDFFTFRGSSGNWDKKGTSQMEKWSIVAERYPQETFGISEDGTIESVIAAAATNRSIENEKLTPMSGATGRGKNYTEVFGHDYSDGAYKYNYFFEEQMAGALNTDAKILLISSWNEWTAVRNENYSGEFKNSFIDHFDSVNTRDLAISRDGNKDNGYMLMCDAVRKWKGARPVQLASAETSIDMASLSSWDSVAPEFKSTKSVFDRDADGYTTHYTNKTARNNIVTSKVARNGESIWFYAKTESKLTDEGDNWMRLYINSDRNHATGWEGYDFRISRSVVESFTGGAWQKVGDAKYTVSDNVLQLEMAKSLLGISGAVDIEFKWVDNADDSDILNFYVDGIAAPEGRFNYLYTEKAQINISTADRAALSGCTVIKAGSSKAVIRGGVMKTFEADTRYGVRSINGVLYMPASMLKDAIKYGTTKITFEADRSFLKIDTEQGMAYTTAGSLAAVKDGRDLAITNPVTTVDGMAYVPVTLLSELFGYSVKDLGNGAFAFGESIDEAAAARAAAQL